MNGATGLNTFSVAITKKVTKVSFMAGITGKLCDIWFTHTDGSTTKTTNCSTCTITTTSTITLTGNLIGLATKPFDGVAIQLTASTSDISVWVDNIAQCSGCPTFFSFPTTIADKTYVVSSQPA